MEYAMAFGFAIISMAYAIGPLTGCHVNPAVSFGSFVAGRMPALDLAVYFAAQIIGGIVGACILFGIANGDVKSNPQFEYELAKNGLACNGWGPGYGLEYGTWSAFFFEFVFTCIFLVNILGSTKGEWTHNAGLSIGFTLAAIHIVGITVTGVSVNPARSFGPALFCGGKRIQQVWLFFVAPLLGAALAGIVFRFNLLEVAPSGDAGGVDKEKHGHALEMEENDVTGTEKPLRADDSKL